MTEPGAPPPLQVTRLCEAHIPAVADIERQCFSQPWSEQALRLLLIDGQGVGYVALEPDGRAVGYAGPGSAGSGGGSRHHRRDLRPSYAGAVAAGGDGTPYAGGGTDGLFGERRCGMGNTENLAFWQAMPAPGWDKN